MFGGKILKIVQPSSFAVNVLTRVLVGCLLTGVAFPTFALHTDPVIGETNSGMVVPQGQVDEETENSIDADESNEDDATLPEQDGDLSNPETPKEGNLSEGEINQSEEQNDLAPETTHQSAPRSPFISTISPFDDVASNHQFYKEILWMFETGLSTGWRLENGTYFLPKEQLSREAMAAFMYRQYAINSYQAPTKSPFTDVPTTHKFYTEISWMYETGLSTGWKVGNEREYRASQPITRDAMAAFLFRQLEPNPDWKAKRLPFTDVTTNTKFSREITWMFESGRSTGFWQSKSGTREYRPLERLTREATAAFLFRSASPVSPPSIGKMTGNVKLQGTGKIGEKVTADTSTWKPTNANIKYQWLRNNTSMSGATKSHYIPVNGDLGASISVKVTISKPGYESRSSTSEAILITKKQVNGKDFVAKNIISDAKMFDGQALTVAEIQNFLDQQLPKSKCLLGSKGFEAGAAYGNTRLASSCLPQMKFNSPGDPKSDQCAAYAAKKNESAAEIIYKVGKGCGVSQKALLVMLQKEQGLITDTWPTDRQFDIAMGYGCYDTGPNYSANCNPSYVGFYEQVSWAAYQLKRYKNVPNRYNHYANKTSSVLYHPNPDCGSVPITMANAATAGLYNYTPYVPNSAALNAGFGTGNSCSSYGNRNFFLYYNQWFGSSQ